MFKYEIEERKYKVEKMIKFNLKKVVLAGIFCLCGTISIFAQIPTSTPNPSPTPELLNLETILKNADAQTLNYREEFKNLLSEETKTFETFDKNGKLKKRTVVESNFIIYQSARDANASSEYRYVFKVDGKLVGDSEKRTTELFEKIAKSDSVQQELERIQKESLRFDKNLKITDLTLVQTPLFADHLRPFFDFKYLGRDVDGQTFMVEYQQTKQSPYILIDEENADSEKRNLTFNLGLPDSIKKSNVLLRGKFWIDAETFQLRREERELTLQTENSSAPLVLLRTEYEYQPSDFKIYAPKKITLTYYELKIKDKGREAAAILNTKATFEYAKFSKSDVEVKSNEVNSPKNQ